MLNLSFGISYEVTIKGAPIQDLDNITNPTMLLSVILKSLRMQIRKFS